MRKGTAPPERLDEIARSLVRRVSVDTAMERLDESDRLPVSSSWYARLFECLIFLVTGLWLVVVFWWFVDGRRESTKKVFAAWLEGKDLNSHELWEFDSGSEMGYALVQDSQVLDFFLWMDYVATEYDA